MKNLIFVFFIVLFFFSQSFAQNCSNLAQSITIRGFSLGMTEADAKKRYPKIEMFKDLDVIGLSNSTIGISYTPFDDVFTNSEREGLKLIALTFFDKKLSQISIVYDGFTEWDSLEEFTDTSAKALKLPNSANWQKTDKKNSLQINCENFYVISDLVPKVGQYDLQETSLFFSLNDFDKNLEERKNTQKESQKKIFKP